MSELLKVAASEAPRRSITMLKDMLSKMPEPLKNYWETKVKRDRLRLIITLIYLMFLVFFHWGIKPELEILLFFLGGILGVYFLDLSEMVFRSSNLTEETQPEYSPFRNVLFQVVFVGLAFFVLTSSGSFFGTGLILSVFLQMLVSERQELSKNGNLNSWFAVIKREISLETQKVYFLVIFGIFILLSLLFI